MTHTVITFLGIRPQQTTYRYEGKKYQGRVFAEAMLQFLTFDRMLVLTTREADQVYPILEEQNDPRIQKVSIPTGRNNAEMWVIFDRVIEHIQEGEEVTFDITHGLRSIPFLAFLFAAYLKSAKNVTLRAILYGALDLKEKVDGEDVAPVLDLSRFAAMLDWINASDQFVQTGNANRLAQLLANVNEQKRAAETLQKVSQAAFLCQPFSLMKESVSLPAELERAANSFSHTSQPFRVLSEKINGVFKQFALADPLNKPVEFIHREWRLIEWYREHGQLLHAITLAREVMLDAIAQQLASQEGQIHLKREQRSAIEQGITGIAKIGHKFHDPLLDEDREFVESDLNVVGLEIYKNLENAKELGMTFDDLTKIRNQLSHAEHQLDRIKLKKVEERIPLVLEKLGTYLKLWGILQSDKDSVPL